MNELKSNVYFPYHKEKEIEENLEDSLEEDTDNMNCKYLD